MTPAQQRAIENRLGRPLTPREVIFEELERRDNRTQEQRFNYQSVEDWQPIPESAKDETDRLIDELERRALDQKIMAMTPEERTVYTLKERRAKALREKENAAARTARLASPEVAKPLAALRELRERMRWDDSYGQVEVDYVDRAIKQYEAPGGCLTTAKQLFIQAFDAERAMKTAIRDDVVANMGDLEARKAELDAALEKLNPESKKPAYVGGDESLKQQWFAAVDAMDADEAEFDALKADVKADAAAVKAARERWQKSLAAANEAEAAFSASKGSEVAHAD